MAKKSMVAKTKRCEQLIEQYRITKQSVEASVLPQEALRKVALEQAAAEARLAQIEAEIRCVLGSGGSTLPSLDRSAARRQRIFPIFPFAPTTNVFMTIHLAQLPKNKFTGLPWGPHEYATEPKFSLNSQKIVLPLYS